MIDMNTVVQGIVLGKVCGIKPDGDSTESKSITLRIGFNGVTLKDVFTKAVSSAVIQWQNGPGRKQFDTWTDKGTVNVEFKAPGRTATDPVADVIGRAKAMSKEERVIYLQGILAQCNDTEEDLT